MRVELLVPDFRGDTRAALAVAKAQPDVVGHNIETVRRLFPAVRPEGSYDTSIAMLQFLKDNCSIPSKSGLMAGLGETRQEITGALSDLRASGVEIVTVGQT